MIPSWTKKACSKASICVSLSPEGGNEQLLAFPNVSVWLALNTISTSLTVFYFCLFTELIFLATSTSISISLPVYFTGYLIRGRFSCFYHTSQSSGTWAMQGRSLHLSDYSSSFCLFAFWSFLIQFKKTLPCPPTLVQLKISRTAFPKKPNCLEKY